jgi:hypothetical protein
MDLKLGYYTVNEKPFYKKLDALLFANTTLADVNWHFNDATYNKQNWSIEPMVSLSDIYKARAQQIRDQYDYVIVMVSGGADSTNVIYSFLKNGIHVDEVIAAAPLSGLNNWEWSENTDPANTISETKFAQLPLLDEIKTHWPNVKITIHDYFEDMVNYKTDEWVIAASSWVNASSSRHVIDKFSHIKNLAESGKKIAKVYGIDKPLLCRGESGNIYSVIADAPVQVAIHDSTKENYSHLETVLFYYTPDMPELLIKQSHLLARWIYLPENTKVRKTMWDRSTPAEYQINSERFSFHHRSSARCIYPSIEKWDRFQARKEFNGFSMPAQDRWIFKLHGKTRLYQQLVSDVSHIMNKLDNKYCDKQAQLYRLHYKHWKIGHEDQFKPTIN